MVKTSANSEIDNLLDQLESVGKETERASILNKISEEMLSLTLEKVMEYSEKGLEISERIGYKFGIVVFLNNIGNVCCNRGDYKRAIECFNRALEIAKELNDEKRISDCLNNFGIVYVKKGNYPRALEYFHESLKISERIEDKNGIARCLNNIAIIHEKREDYQRALDYFKKSLEKNEETDDRQGIADCLNNIGIIYGKQGEYEFALNYFLKSLEVEKDLNDEDGIPRTLNNIGLVYWNQGNYRQALKYYRKSLNLREKLGNKKGICSCLINIGMLYTECGQIQEALDYLKRGLYIAKDIGTLDLLSEVYLALSKLYEKERKYKRALEYYKLYKETDDKLFNEEKSKQIADIQVRYETEQKEREAEIYRLKYVELARANEKIEKAHNELSKAYRKLELISRSDPLTELLNRRGFLERVTYEIHRYERSGKAFSIVIADIDNFKSFNDSYGHDCGDFILKTIAKIVRKTLRKQDSIGRWGGDEFIFLLPETPIEGAIVVAEKLKKKISEFHFSYKRNKLFVTMSFGASTIDKSLDIDICIKKADEALYRAKKSEKNKVVAHF